SIRISRAVATRPVKISPSGVGQEVLADFFCLMSRAWKVRVGSVYRFLRSLLLEDRGFRPHLNHLVSLN
ncbi:MAG: hypothetical protein ACYTBV_14815, partial [Planctomycetota bacterium]